MEEEETEYEEKGRSGREEEDRKEEEEEGEQQEWRICYQNVGRSIETTNILLEKAREEKRDLVFVAEAWEGKKGERTTQTGYRIFSNPGSQLVLYIKEDADLTALGSIHINDTWIAVGSLVTGVYLNPSLTINPLKEHLLNLPPTDNIIGDFNCTQRHKRRALLEMATARNLREAPIAGKTWRRWHRPQSRWMESKPDTVFTMGNWTMENLEWTTSDHAIISGNVPSLRKKRKIWVTDWETWEAFKEDEDKEADYQDPIGHLKKMAGESLRPKKYSPKPWWDAEIRAQRKVTRRAGRCHGDWRKEAAKLRNMIKQKKREHWSSFIEETVSRKAQDIWRVIRVARNPFNTRCVMPARLDEDGGCDTDDQKAQAFVKQHFQGSEEEQTHNGFLRSLKGLPKDRAKLAELLWQALSKTNSHSTPGPDRISYRLLKLLKDTRLGTQTIDILADFCSGRRTILSGLGDGREITVVMIPKVGKDLNRAKGWRPIVLINCLLKLMDKVVAKILQDLPVFHQGQYGSRKGKSAIDMAIQATTEAQLEKTKGHNHAWALGDIKSAFNYTRKANVRDRLLENERKTGQNTEGLRRYIHWFYQPRTAELTWDGEVRKQIRVSTGIPQGSPLSPVLFLIGVAKALENADTRIVKEITSHKIRIYSYVDDFNCTTEQLPHSHPGRQQEAITATKKAREVVSQELEKGGWTRDSEKDEEINFRVQGEAKWVGIHFTHDLVQMEAGTDSGVVRLKVSIRI